MRLVPLLFSLLIVAGAAAPAALPAVTNDLSGAVEFHDSHAFTSGLAAEIAVKPWTEPDKQALAEAFALVRRKAPGLIQRVTAYRPVRFYRTTRFGMEDAPLANLKEPHAIMVGDSLFRVLAETPAPQRLETAANGLAHELVHLADATTHPLERKKWDDLIQPRIDRVKRGLENLKPGLTVYQAAFKEKDERYEAVARQEGFPGLWAARDPGEALAELTSRLVVWKNPPPSKEIRSFLESRFLSKPFKPDPAIQRAHQGLTALENKRWDEAVGAFGDALRMRPEFPEVYAFRAQALAGKAEIDRAIADYTQAAALHPSSQVYLERGKLYALRNDQDKAIEDFSEFIRRVPETEKGYLHRAMGWVAKKDYDRAISDFSAILRLNPGQVGAYNFRGLCWASKREFDKAIADHNEAIRLAPAFVFSYYNRATAWHEKGEFQKAVDDYQTALRLDPGLKSAIEPLLKQASARQPPTRR